MKCNIPNCDPYDAYHPPSFWPSPPLPPTSALVRILFSKLKTLRGVAIPQVAQRVSNLVGAAPCEEAIVGACFVSTSNETLDWIADHVWHRRPRWYQKATQRISRRVTDWVKRRTTPTGPEPLTIVQAVVATKLGQTRADTNTMLLVAQKIGENLVELTDDPIWLEIAYNNPSIDKVERMVSHLGPMTEDRYLFLLDACIQSGHMHLVGWAWTHLDAYGEPDYEAIHDIVIPIVASALSLVKSQVLDMCAFVLGLSRVPVIDVDESLLKLLSRGVETGDWAVVLWVWKQFGELATYRLGIFNIIVAAVSSGMFPEASDTCERLFRLSSNSVRLEDYQIRILSVNGQCPRMSKALKWFIESGMTLEIDLVFEFESAAIRDCESVLQVLIEVMAGPNFRYRLRDQLDMIRSSERCDRVKEYIDAPVIVEKLCAVIMDRSGFALMEKVLKTFAELTQPSPITPKIEKAIAKLAARSNDLEFVRFAYRVVSSTICREVLLPECAARGSEAIVSWLEIQMPQAKRQRLQ
ncbi:hypothetical protein PHYSODRAFT_306938 [Phytophthora sojae]|uniref:Uncharacterized protein n=1 Tax=Phytophthora sojae (strain P6497) TaxID=1094619 RepID=G5ABR4_PHYSP|nr:hypothetical protein PHYSODRAFT_306938 [Phytophthora sojae]EGZ06789.1 hypothetical protein PHYSODRAFT_306938 [Phytophthora sojae]|eukprot:XP_009537553.1 hypothetical protein PHYSODRAFT_306938 [Phytophthora sojae]